MQNAVKRENRRVNKGLSDVKAAEIGQTCILERAKDS